MVHIGPKWRLCSARTWSWKVVGSHQFSECNPVLCCVWEALLFWLLIPHFMASGMCLEFDASHHAVVNLIGLGTVLVLPIARVRLLRLQKQGAITVFPSRACYLAHLSPGLCNKGSSLRIIYNFGTASYQMPSSKLVLNGGCVVQKSEIAKL